MKAPGLALGVVLLFALAPQDAEAQSYAIDQGSAILGGAVSWTTSGGDLFESFEGDRLNSLQINPYGYYFVRPGLALGAELTVDRTSQGDFDMTVLGIGPSVAYYFGGPESSVYPYLQGGVSYASYSADGDNTANGYGFDFGAGAAFMLSPTVALTAEANYAIQSISPDDVDGSVDGNIFGLFFGIAAFIF